MNQPPLGSLEMAGALREALREVLRGSVMLLHEPDALEQGEGSRQCSFPGHDALRWHRTQCSAILLVGPTHAMVLNALESASYAPTHNDRVTRAMQYNACPSCSERQLLLPSQSNA